MHLGKSISHLKALLLPDNPSCYAYRYLQTLTRIDPVLLSNIRDNKGALTPRKRLGRGQGSGHGGTCGRGNGGQKKRSGDSIPYIGFAGGQTPFWKRFPKIKGPQTPQEDLSSVPLERLQRWIDVGRIKTDQPITMKEMVDSGLVRKIKDGVLINDKGAPYFRSKIHIEATQFTSTAIEAIEALGGKAISVYFNKLALRALVKPHKFRIFPRRAEPVAAKAIDYYCDYENRGYIAMRTLPTYPSPTSVFYGGASTPIQLTEPPLAPLRPTLKLLELQKSWEMEEKARSMEETEIENDNSEKGESKDAKEESSPPEVLNAPL